MNKPMYRLETSIVCTHPDDSWEPSRSVRFPHTPVGLNHYAKHCKDCHGYELTQEDKDLITNA